MRKKLPYVWMSFSDGTKPSGSQFLGVVVLRARDVREAMTISHALKINPGGAVMMCKLPPDFVLPEECRYRLLSAADIEKFNLGEACKL